jgi:hypothetical protein
MKNILQMTAVALITGLVVGFIVVLLVGKQSANLGASGTRFPKGLSADSISPVAGEVRGTTLTITGATNLEEDYGLTTATTTLAVSDSNKTTYITTTGNKYTLPAVASAAGTVFRFVVGTAFTQDAVIASAEGDNIEGALIVAGAVVDCDAEDFVNFIADGENLGDFVEVRSNGTSWFIGASGALTASKLTCTDPS